MKLLNTGTVVEHTREKTGSFILSYVLILVFLLILASNQVQFKDTLRSSLTTTTTTSPQLTNYFSSNSDNNLRILIGILTLPDQHLRRNLLRLVYGTQPAPPGAKINVKFVFCNLTKEDQKVLVALEIMRYGDIIILDCKENMNNGKTLTYFSSLPEMLNDTASSYPPYHYMMKTDDDTYLRLNILVQSLKPLSREDLYYGYVIPCRSIDPFVRYMSGMGNSDISRKFEGPEDKVFGEWMREGGKGKHRYNAKWSMFNFPEPPTTCTHELWPETIAVHLLKNQEKWIRTLNYFNVTHGLKPSKLYHIH
ncbi:hypothetical protein AAZX31_12G133200 [Glycine max]